MDGIYDGRRWLHCSTPKAARLLYAHWAVTLQKQHRQRTLSLDGIQAFTHVGLLPQGKREGKGCRLAVRPNMSKI